MAQIISCNTSRPLPSYDPETLRDAEDFAIKHLHLTSDILCEGVGRTISDVAFESLTYGPGSRKHSDPPSKRLIILLLGEKRASCRALVAGRYMVERGATVIACQVKWGANAANGDTEDDPWSLTPHLKRFHGKVMSWKDLSDHVKTLNRRPDILVDAIFGNNPVSYRKLIKKKEYNVFLEITEWANHQAAASISVDLPSGTDPHTGECPTFADEPLGIMARMVVISGTPSQGLFEAMRIRSNEGYIDDFRLHVVDCGIQTALTKLPKVAPEEADIVLVDFEGQSVLNAEFFSSVAAEKEKKGPFCA